MLIFDAHLDMAWNATEWNRDLMLPVETIRKFERQFTDIVPGDCTCSWVELKRGRVGLTICTLLPRLHRKDKLLTFPQSREAAYAISYGQLAYYRAMVTRGVLREVHNLETLNQHVNDWLTKPVDTLPIGYILSMEGSPPILSPEQIAAWYADGLRILGPAHYGPNPYCYGTGSSGGFNEEGKRLLREMDKVGMLLDVTHLADESFWDALEVYQGPVLASHHNCRALVPGDRQLADEQIKALIERNAVIGAAFDNWMIRPGWKIGVSDPSTVTMGQIVDHIDHICQLAGNARHCGIGSDLDGGFGKEQSPSDLDTIADLGNMAELLRERGYSEADIEGILYRNWVEFFRRAWSR
jgi:membrane dipeptidase